MRRSGGSDTHLSELPSLYPQVRARAAVSIRSAPGCGAADSSLEAGALGGRRAAGEGSRAPRVSGGTPGTSCAVAIPGQLRGVLAVVATARLLDPVCIDR